MTVIPSRVENLKHVLISLLTQTIQPDLIYLNVPKKYNRFDQKFVRPEFLNEKYFKKVKINYLDKDYGPASKFIGSLMNDKINDNDLILITDDDLEKVKDWAETLKKYHENEKITCFEEKNLGKEILWGYLGYIFQKKIFNIDEILEFYSNIKEECNLVDDHWFTGFCHYKKIQIYNIPIMTYEDVNKDFSHGGSKNSLVRLAGENSRAHASEKCRKIIKEKYNTVFPFWCCLGCCGARNRETFENVSNISPKTTYILLFILILFFIKKVKVRNICLSILAGLAVFYSINKKKNYEGFSKKIPKVIMQTYFDKKRIPKKVYKNIKMYASEYKHIVFDDEQIIKFLKKHYSNSVLKTFHKLKGAHKADLFRYCYLYIHGGVYLDIKTELVMPISNIFYENHTYSVLSIVKNSIYQGIIATPASNPIFLKLINFMIRLVELNKPYHYIIFTLDFYQKITDECYHSPEKGLNINKTNGYNYYLFVEKCTERASDCYDGLDKHKLCCNVFDNKSRIIKTRYADFPW